MKKAILGALGIAALGLGGCAEIQTVTNWLASPTTTQAAQNVKTFTTSIECAVASVSSVESQLAPYLTNGQAAISTSTKVCVAAEAVCAALGGQASIKTCSATLN